MRGMGVLEDGYLFAEEDLERGTPRFWWGFRKRMAFDRALARRGLTRKDGDDDDEPSSAWEENDHTVPVESGATEEPAEKKTESNRSWFASWGSGGSDGGGSPDGGGGSSDGGGGSDGGGSSGE